MKDKKTIGLIADVVCSGMLLDILAEAFRTQHFELRHYVFYGAVVLILLVLLKSMRVLTRQGKQTKLSVVGKTFTLFFSLGLIPIAATNSDLLLSNVSAIMGVLLAILVIIFVPYSFYLFKTDRGVEKTPKAGKSVEIIKTEGTATEEEFICSKCHMSINWGDPYCSHCGDKLDYD